MKYTLLVTWTDLSDETPRVVATPIDADSKEAAEAIADDLAYSGDKLMDLVVEEWRQDEHLRGLKDMDLLRAYGVAFGDIQIYCGDHFVAFVESPFTPCEVNSTPKDSRREPD